MRSLLPGPVHGVLTLLLALFASAALAQVPTTSPGVPAQSFLGEGFCFDTTFSNSGATGYGPYYRLVLPPELGFNSAELFGAPLAVISNQLFPVSGQLNDPLALAPASAVVSAPQGFRLLVLQLPVGSVTAGGPPLESNLCLNIAPGANVGTAYPVSLTPVYRFGDTPTGSNGSIIGSPPAQSVTPTVLRFRKSNGAVEQERPPGAIWPYTYTLVADIANTAVVNPLVLRDQLPADVQFVGPVSIVGGVGCAVTLSPPLGSPGGVVEVQCSGNTVGTAADADVSVSFPAHIIDTLDELSCATELQTNSASAQATYVPSAGAPQPLALQTDTSDVVAKHLAVQKSVSPGGGAPGAALTYTLAFQTTEFAATSALSVLDTLPDGIDFVAHVGLTVNGSPIAIAPTVTPGVTDTIAYDIGAAVGSDLPPGSTVSLSYTAVVRQTYEGSGEPVLAADPLTNTVVASYALRGGATGCSDGSAATFLVQPLEIRKQLLSTGPFFPGDFVTFRLAMDVPSGDTRSIRFRDFFPLPVFAVSGMNLSYGGPDVFRALGGVDADTLNLTPTSITVDPPNNALIVEFPDINTTSPQVLAIDVRVQVTSTPFADGLFLTNIFRASANNTGGEELVSSAPVQFSVRAPALRLNKGVLTTSRGTAPISPAPTVLPVNGNASGMDAGDSVTYRITLENSGGAPAYNVVVTDPGAVGLNACTVVGSARADGVPLTTSGSLATGLTLLNGASGSAVLAPNDGSAGAPFAGDTAFVDVQCVLADTVAPGQSILNTASATWMSQPLGTPGVSAFPPISDDASVGIALPALTKSRVATSEAHTADPFVAIGEIVRYRLATRVPEGQISDFRVFDVLPNGLSFLNDGSARVVFVSNDGGLSSSTLAAIPTISGSAASAAITPLAAGLDLGANAAVNVGTGTLNCAAPGSFATGTDVCFRLGNLANADRDADDEFVVIEFNVLVDNSVAGSNDAGETRNNVYRVGSGTSQLGGNSGGVSSTIAEPSITNLLKSVSPASADAGDTVTYTVTFSNAAGTANSTAFEISLLDTLPADLSLNLGSINVSLAGGASGITNNSAGNSIDLLIGSMPPGSSVNLSYTALVLNTVAPGTALANTANLAYSSLPGAGSVANPTGSTTPGAGGSDGGERNGSGVGPNDYRDTDTATLGITAVTLGKSLFSTSLPFTQIGQVRPAVADLTIGEIATFRITATLPEGTIPQVVIADQAPFAGGVLEILSGSVISISPGLSPAIPNPIPSLSDAQLGDSINDRIEFNFGQVLNPPAPGEDTIVIEVVTRVRDLPANASGDQLTNTASVQFGPGLSGTATAPLDLVEPQLLVDKVGSLSSGQAGDDVDFNVVLSHGSGSTANAQAVQIVDTLPPQLVNLRDLLFQTTGTCLPAPVVVNASTLTEIAIGVDQLPLGCQLELSYTATLDTTVATGASVVNTANASYRSVDPAAPDGPFGRAYAASDSHTIAVTVPGMVKSVFATSEPDTGSAQLGAGVPDLTIGERVTYRFTATLPAGVSPGAVVEDQLPTGTVSMRVLSSRIVSVGSAISGAPAVGTAGVASDGADADTFNDRVVWTLGTLTTAPGGAAGSNQIEFEVIAQVMDSAGSVGGVDDQINTASLRTDTAPTAVGTVAVDIVEPRLQLAKAIATPAAPHIVQAGDVVTYELTLSHQTGAGGSTADAYNLVVTDQLPNPGASFIIGSTSGTCAGVVTDASAAPLLSFSLPTLPLASASCTLRYQVTVSNAVNPGLTYSNSAALGFDSQPLFVAGETRRGNTSPVSASFVVWAPTLVKVTSASDLSDTGAGAGSPALLDLAIGETVTYTLTVGFPQGTSTNAVLVDRLPASTAGVLQVIGAGAVVFGNPGISTSLPGTPVFSDALLGDGRNDTTTFNFGTLLNPADGDTSNDWLQVTVVARVVNLPQNQAGIVLTNQASFSTGTTAPVTSSASIDVVEPVLAIDKTMGPLANGVVQIGLQLSNSGGAPAYDIEIVDILDAVTWNLASVTPVSVPAGFLLDSVPGPGAGQLTVRLRSDPAATLPQGAVPAGGSVAATFSVALASIPPTPNPVLNTATNTGASSYPGGTNPDDREYPDINDTASLDVPGNGLTKTFVLFDDADASGNVSPGDVVRFTLRINNPASTPLTGVELDETVPAHTLFSVAGSTPGWSCANAAPAGTPCTLVVGTVPAASTVDREFAVRIVNPLPAGVIGTVNQASIRSNELPTGLSDDPSLPGDEDPTPVPIVAAPDLLLLKTDGGVSTAPGATLVYTLSYRNIGNQDATGVVVTETVPLHARFNAAGSSAGWSCANAAPAGTTCTLAIGNLAAGAAAGSLSFALTVDTPLPAGVDQIANTARIDDDGSNGPDPNPGNNQAGDTTPVGAAPDLQIGKTDGGASTTPGGVVVYALSFRNVGNQNATGVVISETVPLHARFNAAASSPGWSCADAAPAGTACTLAVGALAAGAAPASANFAVIVDSPLAAGVEQLANTATIADDGSNGPDPTPGDNSASDTTPVGAAPDLTLAKTDGGVSGAPGAVVVYTLSYANVGNQNATGVVITETVPSPTAFNAAASSPGWSCADAAPTGSTCTLAIGAVVAGAPAASVSFAVRLPDPIPAGITSILNTAVIADDGSNGPDPTPGNNSASDTTPIGAAPDLLISKTDGGISTSAGGSVVYTLAYQNVGSQNASGVVITETVPAHTRFAAAGSSAGWSCADAAPAGTSCTLSIGALNAGGSGNASFALTVLNPLPAGVEQIENTVTIADDGSGGPDPTPGNNSATDTTPVGAAPDLQVSKTDGDISTAPGGTVVYSLGYRNVGTQNATGVVLSETVPLHARFSAAGSSPGWSCADAAPAGTACTLAVGAVAAGAPVASANFAVIVDSPLPAGVEQIANTVSIADDGANGPDPTPGDNTASDTTPVNASPDLTVTKTPSSTQLLPGQVLVYEIRYRNVGSQNATGVELIETVPVHTRYNLAGSSPGWSCADNAAAGSTCLLAIGPLAAGAEGVVQFAVRIESSAFGQTLRNTVRVRDDGGNGPDPTPDNNVDDVDVRVPVVRPAVIPSMDEGGRLLLVLLVLFAGGWSLRRRFD